MEKTIEIPEGYEARIEGNKVILERKESEDEKIMQEIIQFFKDASESKTRVVCSAVFAEWAAYLERQKEQEPINECNTHELTLDESRKWNEAYEKGYSLGYENRRNEQKPAEWSEEDKNFIKELCNLLASIAKNNYVGGYYAPDLVSKLQSLRPQPHWKPSEEQMEALMLAIEGKWEAILPTGYMSRRLEDLYEGLVNTFGVECKLEE